MHPDREIAGNHMHPDRDLPEKARGCSTAVRNPRREPSSVCNIWFLSSQCIDQEYLLQILLPRPNVFIQHDECGQVYNIPPLRQCKGHQAGKHDVGSRTARNMKKEVKGHHTYVDNSVLAQGDKHNESHASFEHVCSFCPQNSTTLLWLPFHPV
jgi:hypothetical protein